MADDPTENLSAALTAAHPELEAVRAAATEPVYLVGGAIRDVLLGRPTADIDLVVEGDAAALAARLGAEVVEHERFMTAMVVLDGHRVDIAAARTERYPSPGALPEVTPAAAIEDDLARRDFTINAIAVPLAEPRLIDPHGGRADLDAGLLRVLHDGSFVDDPTRAIRAARYAARLGLSLEERTGALLRETDLGSVSTDRREAELLRLAAEDTGPDALALLADWGLLEPRSDVPRGGLELARETSALLSTPPWEGFAPRGPAILRAVRGPAAETGGAGREVELSQSVPGSPSEGHALVAGRDPVELALARALGAEWLDEYLERWSLVELEIGGRDLLEAGIPAGPAVGAGLADAKRRKLDGELSGREQELAAALAAAREA